MKFHVATDPTSSIDRSASTSWDSCPLPPALHVPEIGPRQIVCTTRTLNLGGARLPRYTHWVGEPSSKSKRYANHSVGSMSAGSDSRKPLNRRLWASVRRAELNPPATVGGTFAIVTVPSTEPRPLMTSPSMPVITMLSKNPHQSSLLL